MSWSISTELHQSDSERMDTIVQLNSINKDTSGNQQCIEERNEQIDACIVAIQSILVNAGFLKNSKDISIILRGHANKEHNKDKEWSNEFIGIEIYTKSYEKE